MSIVQPIHPFPARMAPEIALEEAARLSPGSIVLDPMAGSGTVIRTASEQQHRAYGFDMDPLAVLMARVWTTPIDPSALRNTAADVIEQTLTMNSDTTTLPWIDGDEATRAFIDYWFGKAQQTDLRKLSYALHERKGTIGDALRIALSKIIITKDHGASLARDVSHSRPHRVRENNDFQVMTEFRRSVQRLAQRLEDQPPPGGVTVEIGDARRIDTLAAESIDAVITSPPYLNAIDYMRGHRLTLVWLGYRVGDLRAIRAKSIGTERMPDAGTDDSSVRELIAAMDPIDELPHAQRRMIDRYVLDLFMMVTEIHRVLRRGGRAVFVVGNSSVRGVFIKNALAVSAAAERAGFDLIEQHERDLPPSRRYLPPPAKMDNSMLERRMRTETVLTFRRTGRT